MMVSYKEISKQCPCNIDHKQKQIVEYDFGMDHVIHILVCKNCLKSYPWNQCIRRIDSQIAN